MLPRFCFAAYFICAALSLHAQNSTPLPDPGDVYITIRIITLENDTVLSLDEREKMLAQIRRKMSREQGADMTADQISGELAERVRAEYQNRGYFLAEASARLIPVHVTKARRTYDAVVTVLNEGQQYRLKEIRWSGMKAFTERELLSVMPINP